MSRVDAALGQVLSRLPGRSAPDAESAWLQSKHEIVGKPRNETKPGRLRQKDIAWVCEQLAVTQEAGLPLYRALGLLAGMRKGGSLAARLRGMQAELGEGRAVSEVFAAQERDWGSIVVALVAAGEASGRLGESFSRAAELVQTRLRLRRKLRTALTYPMVVMIVTAVLVATLLVVVVPRFEEIYASLDAELPSVTLFVIALSQQVPLFLLLVAGLGAGVWLVLRASRTNKDLARQIDVLRSRIPVFGSLIEKNAQARISATMGILLSSGVPLLEVITFSAATAGSSIKQEALRRVRQEVADGATFSAALAGTEQFPELMVQLVAVGEESGSLPDMMERFAARSAEEVESATAALTSLAEPLLMAIVGVVVGVFLLALYLPIISLSSQIG